MSFVSLGLSAPILKALEKQGYETPSPIQAQAIPAVLEGKDVMAAAQTGTGKTAGFTLPILELLSKGQRAQPNQVRALILTPTRELAAQVSESVDTYGQNMGLHSTVVFGGVKINPQMMKLRKGADVLVATPGRLMDLYNQNAVKFKSLEILVLDEADRMLDMGFIRDIRKILSFLPKDRQNLLFSATFSEEIRELARGLLNDPVEISVTPRNAAATTVKQWICPVDKKSKAPLLIKLIKDNQWQQVLVFSRTKHGANKLTKQLEDAGISAAAIHGNKSQGARTKALAGFKAGDVRALVATDIAARGIDIDQLPQVVNFDLPNVPEDYVHRIGRTGRAGSTGQAVSLVTADEAKQLSDVENLIQKLLDREIMPGFEPVNPVPESRLRAQKPKKPKKPKQGHAEHHKGSHDSPASKRRPQSTGGGQKQGGGQNANRTQGQNRAKDSSAADAAKPAKQNRRRRPANNSSNNNTSNNDNRGNRSPRSGEVNGNR
jgi:ATP-dependent RNA helicase RhlE